MRSVLRKYYLLLVCTLSLFTANNSLQAQNVLDQAGLTSATPAAAAYGTRKLSSAYTGPVMRIRRALDNAEADLAFDASGILSSSSTATFVSGGTGTLSLNSFAAATDAFVSIWYDQSGNGRHATQTLTANQPMIVSAGTVINNPNLSNKPTITFNGSNSFLNLPMSSTLVNAAGTIAAVQVQPSLQSGFNAVVAWSSTSGGTQGPGFGPLNALGAFGLYTTWGPQNLNMGPVVTNQKYIMNASWSGNGNVIVESKNGNQLTGSFGAAFNFVGNAWIGRDNGGYYNGSMAELIVSTTTISSSNRTAMEQSQGSFYGVSLTSAGALNFDGVNDYVNVGNVLGTSYTKEAWVNIGNTTATDNFISGGASSQHAFWAPSAYANRLSAGHNEIWNQVQDPTPLNVGQWYHVAVTYDAPTTTMKLYKNGVLVSTNTAVPAYIGGGNLVLLGAYDANLNLLNGSMDEVRIWSRVLCQGEILNNMNGVLSGTQTGLSAYYKFNQGWVGLSNTGINTLIDESGNGKNGSLVGFSLTGNTSNWVAGTVTGTSAVFTNTPSPIVGANSVCIGATTTLTNANSGIWSSSNTAVATVSATGLITGVSAGSAVISFNNLCGAVSSKLITVSAIPTISIANPTPNVNLGNAATLTATSNLGKALQFNGTNSVEMSTGVVLPNTFTQEAWIFSTSGADNAYHGFLGNTAASTNGTLRSPCMYVFNGNTLHGGFGDGTQFYYYITQPGVIAPNTWYHVAQTFDGTVLKCFVNGVEVPLATVMNNPAGKTPVATPVKTLGKLDNNFIGTIDEVRMWNVVRTPTQLLADMNKGVLVNSTGLVAYWKLDEGTGTSTYDIKQGTVGTLIGSPIWVASTAPIGGAFTWSPSYGLNNTTSASVIASPPYTTTYTATVTDGTSGCAVNGTTVVTVFDIPGKAMVLDGTNDYVKVADNASLDFGGNDFTIETWTLKKANSSGYTNSGIVGKWNTGAIAGTNEWILNNTVSGSDNKPAFWIESGNTIHQLNGTTVMNIGEWYHLAIVRKGTLMSMYVNGVLNASITIPAGTVLNNVGRDLIMGAYQFNAGNPTIYSSVTIDELRIWNRAVCLDEMNNNRSGELSGTQNGLLAYYKFNKGFYNGNNVGVSLVLPDISGNNNNGTLINFAETATGNWTTSYFNSPNPVYVPTTTPITGITSACIGATRTLANTNQGVWSSSNTSVATVNAAGVVTAIADGTTTITFTNTCGGISTITFTVNPKPTASISTASPLTVCLGAAVLLDASTNASPATYQWFKNGAPIPTATNASFNAIASGSYTVVVTNASGCVSNTSNALQVTIEDIIKPYFSSGGTVTSATNAQGQVLATSALGAVVTYNAPVGADNCTVVSNVLTAGYASGSVFPIGTTTVTYTVTDAAGLTETSSFDVVVSGLAPAIIAPANITVNNDEGQCGAAVSFAASGSVGVPVATIVYTEDGQPVVSGSSFAIGVHTITATATNAVGSSSVNFTITVVNTDHPTITAQGPTVFCEDGSVTLTASEGSSYMWSTGETTQSITVYSAGTYSAIVNNAFGCPANSNEITTTTIALPTAPEITGAEQVCANSNTILTANISGGVWTSQNESIATVDAQGHVTGISEGSVQIMYAVTNESGCTSIGYFTVYVKPLPLPGLITGNTEICAGVTSRLDVSNPNGRNDDRSVWTTSNATVVTIVEYPSGIDITGNAVGTATITKTLNLNGCTAVIATAVITVKTIPIFTVIPENKTVYSITNQCNAVVNYLVEATGPNTPTLAYSFTGATTGSGIGTGSGQSFNVGITNVTITATNQCGSSNISFTVTVTDIQDPVINAPANISVIATSAAGAMVTYVAPVGTDNCSSTTVMTAGLASGSTFPIGVTTVTYTVTDASGNTASASFTVTVRGLAPVVIVPSNISVNNIKGQCNAIVNFAATDNTGIPASTITYTENGLPINSGATLAVGTHTITATATNVIGASTKTFTITVVDNEAPGGGSTISFPAPALALNNIPEAANYNLVYALDVPNRANFDTHAQVPYFVNNAAALSNTAFNRVAYLVDLGTKWVWVSFDKISSNLNEIGIPADYVKKQAVSNMNVFSSVNAGVTNGTNIATGNVEFWPNCYNTDASNLSIPAGNNGRYDFNDNNNLSTDCYGSFQVHNYVAGQTIFAYNSWSNGGSEIGIGNQVGGSGHPDWTFSNNAASYSVKKIYVFVSDGGVQLNKPTINLDANGQAALAVSQVDPGITDNCGIATRVLSKTNFDCTNLGANTVTLTVTDIHGNVYTGNTTVTVVDNIVPTITCPSNVVVNATSAAGALVNYTAPVGLDNCTATTVRTDGLASGSIFPIGVTTVTYKVTDASGNSAQCSFTVTVNAVAPLVVVPENITVNVDENTCGAAVSFAATDNTGIPASTITYTENGQSVVSGAIFSTGIHTITATATNVVGSSSANFTITVIDNQLPVISAPANISVVATSAAGAMVTYVAPVGTDNCLSTTVMTAGLASGSTFPIGVTTVTYTVTDASGNTASASFTVTVRGLAPVIVVPENITQNNDAGQCGASVSFAATETTAIPASTIVYTEDGQTIVSGHFFSVGTHTITATATNAVGSSSGTFTITVNDVEKPTITVAAQTQSADAGVCKALVTVASPLTADNCAVASVVNDITGTNNASAVYPVGTTTITWTVTDIHGNITTATQNITVKDEEKPIVLTQNITVQLNASGAASITAAQINNGSTDNCGIASITVDKTSFYCSNVGVNTVTLTVTDIHGNVNTATAEVTVQDKVAPMALAKNITVGLSAVGGTVSISAADINNGSSDACGIASMTVMPASFSCANIGANTVTLTVTDVNGNVSSTTAIVTVKDDKGPVPTAVLPVISGQCYATALTLKRGEKAEMEDGRLELDHYYLVSPTAMDNCSGLIKGTTTDPLTYYNQGTYIIHWKFVDARGNVTIQEQTVIVKDTQAPTPKYASLPTITGQCSVSLVNTNSSDDDGDHEGREGDDHDGDDDEDHYDEHQRGAPWAKDNCSGWVRGTTTDPLTYSVQGTYIIHWTFNDGHGNISTQNQTVIVKDITKPKIKAPSDKTVTCGSNVLPAVMGTATATDNCSVPVISYTDVNSGNQIVRTWRATDAAGNFSTAVQTIKLTTAFSGSVVSVPTSNVYTGGEVNNLYLGYGAQGTALTVTGLPSSGAPYTYSWTGVATNRLSATNTAAPVFSPIAGGVYTFTVTMTNKNGCSNTASISICVTDIRVPGSNGALVYVCHKGTGKTGGTKTLEVPVAQVASHIQTNTCGGKNDRLGSCDQNPCNSGNSNSAVDPKQLEEPIEVKPDVKLGASPIVTEELKVVVMPNPTTTYFTIRLESKDKAPVNLRVMDGSGRVIDAKQKMEPNSSFQMGHGYSSGTYYAEFIQGNKRKVIQLIKGRG